ncbi:MAG: transcriptional repressor LexA [Anaerolineae bacterium]|nr:transcriptional repressor LexA [Anaerolineae bacterium]
MVRKRAGMGERHQKIMRYLSSFQEKNGYSPSIRQIGLAIGVNSTSLVDYYLNQLQQMGYIERDEHVSRSIRILNAGSSLVDKVGEVIRKTAEATEELIRLPVLGRIRAGEPIPVPQSDLPYFDAETSIDVARSLLPAREENLFALEVEGDSMIDAMINDGDIVVMKKTEEAQNGEMVAVWLDDTEETTLKYFYREKNRVRLQPANPTMKPIYLDNSRRFRIMGKVVMVIRQVAPLAV